MSPVTASTAGHLGPVLRRTVRRLRAAGVATARQDAELILAHLLGTTRLVLRLSPTRALAASLIEALEALVVRRAAHEPLQYLLGEAEFLDMRLRVGPGVFIPRPETELLVDHVLQVLPTEEPRRVLDVCTGSGCIAVSVAKRLPAAHVTATDVSEAALEIARRNAAQHGVATRVEFVRADWFDYDPKPVPPPATMFDLILSNPPYVAEAARQTLPPNVREHEPGVALFAGGEGLDAFRKIAEGVRAHLRPGGCLLIEIGRGQADEVESLLVETAGLRPVARFKDLAGIERALQLTLPA